MQEERALHESYQILLSEYPKRLRQSLKHRNPPQLQRLVSLVRLRLLSGVWGRVKQDDYCLDDLKVAVIKTADANEVC